MQKRSSSNTLTDVSTAAEVAGVSRQTLYNWIEKGVVGHTYDVGGRPVFTQYEVEQIADLAHQRKQILAQWPVSATR